MNLYVDASALLKLLLREPEAESAEAIWDAADRLATVNLTYSEARSALGAARRARRLSVRGLQLARDDLEERWGALDAIVADEALSLTAGEVAEKFALRALDAMHLAAALSLGDPELVVATWDERLREASQRAGLAIAPA